MPNKSYTRYIDTNPEPVDEVPPPRPLGSPGRNKTPEYVALQSRLMLRPGVDHKIAVLPSGTPKEKKQARTIANSLRSTLRRYNITLTERDRDGVFTLYGKYTNGTTPE